MRIEPTTTLTKRVLYQLANEATEPLVVRERTSNYFHCSGLAPPSDLVRESRLGLGAMILGIEHVGLSSRG